MPARLRILVVEDEAVAGLMAQEALSEAGYEVVGPARTASEALDLAAATQIDLAIVDIRLAGEGDGVAVARALARTGAPSLFVSAETAKALASRDAALGLLHKPYGSDELVAAARAALEAAAGRRPASLPAHLELFVSAA